MFHAIGMMTCMFLAAESEEVKAVKYLQAAEKERTQKIKHLETAIERIKSRGLRRITRAEGKLLRALNKQVKITRRTLPPAPSLNPSSLADGIIGEFVRVRYYNPTVQSAIPKQGSIGAFRSPYAFRVIKVIDEQTALIAYVFVRRPALYPRGPSKVSTQRLADVVQESISRAEHLPESLGAKLLLRDRSTRLLHEGLYVRFPGEIFEISKIREPLPVGAEGAAFVISPYDLSRVEHLLSSQKTKRR